MVQTEESGRNVSKLTFRNVSCFVFVAFRLAQRSATFPAVRKYRLNKTPKVEGKRLGYLCCCYRRAPFRVSLQQSMKLPSTVHVLFCLVNWKEL